MRSPMPASSHIADRLESVGSSRLPAVRMRALEIHDLVSFCDATRPELGDLGLDVIDRDANMVEAEPVQLATTWITQRPWVDIPQELDLGS